MEGDAGGGNLLTCALQRSSLYGATNGNRRGPGNLNASAGEVSGHIYDLRASVRSVSEYSSV